MTEDGHKDTHGAPKGGWPTFDKNGKRVTEEKERVRAAIEDLREEFSK